MLTASFTVGGAIVIYVLSRLVVEPVIEVRRIIGRVDYSLTFYANLYANPGSGTEEAMTTASTEARRLASELLAQVRAVPCYGVFAFIRWLPTMSNCRIASGDLIGLSNSVHGGNSLENEKMRNEILWALRIR